jgi:hypothetical protein
VPARQAAGIVARLARAVQAAHEARIVHRDLKPANVLVTPRWDLKIADFGLARRLDEPGLTGSGAVVGTPHYMAPEQAAGRKDIGPAVDVHALGAILYQLLTGQPPFRGQTVMDVLQAVIHEDPVRPTRLNDKVPPALETICLACLEKQPANRYATAGDLADDLERFGRQEPIRARPVGPLARLWRSARRRPAVPVLLGLAGLALVSLVVGSYFAWQTSLFRGDVESARAAADEERRKRLEKEEEAAQRLAKEQQRDQAARRRDFQAQLLRARVLWPADPARGRALLEDARRCPEDLRDDDWRLLHRLCGRDRKGTLAEPADCRSLLFLPSPVGQASLALAPDSKVLAVARPVPAGSPGIVGRSEKEVFLLALDTGRPLRHLGRFPAAGAPRLAFAPGGAVLALVVPPRAGRKENASVRLFDVITGAVRRTVSLPAAEAPLLAFSPDGKLLALGGRPPEARAGPVQQRPPAGEVRLVDARTGARLGKIEGHGGDVDWLAFSGDGRSLASAALVFRGDRFIVEPRLSSTGDAHERAASGR